MERLLTLTTLHQSPRPRLRKLLMHCLSVMVEVKRLRRLVNHCLKLPMVSGVKKNQTA